MTQNSHSPFSGHSQQETFASGEINLFESMRVVWNAKWKMLIGALVLGVLAAYYALEVASEKFVATSRLALEVRAQQLVDIESVISGVSTEQAAINTELEIIRSRDLLEKLVIDMELTGDPEFNTFLNENAELTVQGLRNRLLGLFGIEGEAKEPPTEEQILRRTVGTLRDAIETSSERNTYIMRIIVTSEDPLKARQIANRLAEIYLSEQIKVKFEATRYATDWLSERVSELEVELNDKEDAIKDLNSETNLISVEVLEALNIRAKDTRDRLNSTLEADEANQLQLETLTAARQEISDDQALANALDDTQLRNLARRIAAGQDGAQAAFDARLDALELNFLNQSARLSEQKKVLESSLLQLQEQIEEQRADLLALNQLTREAEATRVLYETFLVRLKETSLQIGLQRPDTRVLSRAIPGSQIAPRTALIVAAGAMLGMLFGLGLTFAGELRKRAFRTVEDLEQATGVSVFGQIPRMPFRKRSKLMAYLRENPTSPAAEALRNMRTSLMMSDLERPPQIIMSTSSVPGEGKTTQAISLALNLHSLKKRVLLMEGDLRRQTLLEYFPTTTNKGIQSVLTGEAPFEDVVIRDERTGLDILIGEKSSSNAADLLTMPSFGEFLNELRGHYDHIIIDTPPVLVVPDARIIGPLADSIIYSVRWDHTYKAAVLNGLRELSTVGLSVNGLVFSLVDVAGMKRYGNYGGYYGNYQKR